MSSASNTTTSTNSTVTSFETQTTDATVRVDTFATHVTATDPTGGTAYDQQLAVASGVHVNGQLGASTLDTNKGLELCIPSTAAFP